MRELEERIAEAIERYDAELKRWKIRVLPGMSSTVLVERWPSTTDDAAIEREYMSTEQSAKYYVRHAAMKAALYAS